MNKKIIIALIILSILFVAFFVWEQWQASTEWAELISKLIIHLGFPAIVGVAVLHITGIMEKVSEIKDSNAETKQDITAIKDSNAEVKKDISELKDYNEGLQYYREENYETAFSIWEKLAQNGDMEAQFNLALLYYNGKGVSKNYDKAFSWFSKAAEQGHADSQYDLALMYERGESVAQNYDEAIKWYLKSAKQGHAIAQYNLAHKYAIVKTSIKNLIKAYMWASIAEANGVKNANTLLQVLNIGMTTKDMKKAQEMAKRCIESNYQNCGEE